MKRIKILARKNLNMSEGKLAAQCVHAALGLNAYWPERNIHQMSVVVLQVSDTKFREAAAEVYSTGYVVHDAGYTEVKPGTETCLAFYEDDPRTTQSGK